MDEFKEFNVTFAELRSAWHAIAEEYGTSNEDDPSSFARLRTDAAFQRLLRLCDWTLVQWNAEVAAQE